MKEKKDKKLPSVNLKVKLSEKDKKQIITNLAEIVPIKKENYNNNWCSTLDFLSPKKRNY